MKDNIWYVIIPCHGKETVEIIQKDVKNIGYACFIEEREQ